MLTGKLHKNKRNQKVKKVFCGVCEKSVPLTFIAELITMLMCHLKTSKNICSLPVTLPKEWKQTNVIDHYVTRDRLNNASFRQKLDPIVKNIFRRQNLLKIVFEDISTFDAQNLIIGSLLREFGIEKKRFSERIY